MKGIPDIVKQLKKEEEKGLLFYYKDSSVQLHEKKFDDREYGFDNLKRIFENISIGIVLIDENEQIVFCNKYFEDLLKVKKNNILNELFIDVCPIENWQKIKKLFLENESIYFETKIKLKKFDELEVEINVKKFEEVNGLIVTIKDISTVKKDLESIKKSEIKYRNLFNTAIEPIVILDENGFFTDVNRQVTNILGYKKTDLIGKRFDEAKILSKDSAKKAINNFSKRIKGETIRPYEIDIITKDGECFPAEINASVLSNDKGDVTGEIVILRDLRDRSVRESIERKRIESERKFKEIFNDTSDFLVYLNTKGKIVDVNKTVLDLSGFKKDEIIGKTLSEFKNLFSEKDLIKHISVVKNCISGIGTKDYESELKAVDDVNFRFLFSVESIQQDGVIKGILFKGRDITQRQRAWDELVKLEEKYRVLAETSADGVITIDNLGRLTYVNPSFERICGRRKSQILATLFRSYLSDNSVYLFQQVFIDARKKFEKISGVELEMVQPKGNVVPIEVNIAPLKKDGRFAGIIGTIRDITDRKHVEEELKKSERLKTEFMNIAAHELKSPVTPIKGYLDLIIADEDASEKVKKWAKVSLRNSERLLKLVNDILDVSRLDTDTMRFDMEKVNPTDILDEIAEDMKPAIEAKGLEFILHIPKDMPDIMGDRHRLAQVLKNLMVNALKFTDNGSIALLAKKEKNHIIIAVEDSGVGMSEQEMKKIFEKFYQAYTGDDRKNEGTGLGLFICKQIVEKHHGKIWAESNIKEGSTFKIKLPHL